MPIVRTDPIVTRRYAKESRSALAPLDANGDINQEQLELEAEALEQELPPLEGIFDDQAEMEASRENLAPTTVVTIEQPSVTVTATTTVSETATTVTETAPTEPTVSPAVTTLAVAQPTVSPAVTTLAVAQPTVSPVTLAVAQPTVSVAALAATASTDTGTGQAGQENVVPPPVNLDQMVADIHQAQDTDGVAFARSTTNNTRSYTAQRRKIINDFLLGLFKQSPKYDTYLKRTSENVPEYFPAREVEILFILLSGPADKRKKVSILNNMLIDWVASARKKSPGRGGSIYHSPSTLNFMVRSLFASTKDYYNWDFCYADFNFDGGFNGFFKTLCEQRRKEDVSVVVCFLLKIHLNNHLFF